MDRTSKEVYGLLAYGLGGLLMIALIMAGVAIIPWIMDRTGYAAWLFAQSTAHPLLVGEVLLLTGVLLLKTLRRVYGQE